MHTDMTIMIEELPILDNRGDEYGIGHCAEVDLVFDGDEVNVERVRFLSQRANGNPHVIFGPLLHVYADYIAAHYDSVLQDALVDWVESKSGRIADARNAWREAV